MLKPIIEDGKSYVDAATYNDLFRTYREGYRTQHFRAMGK